MKTYVETEKPHIVKEVGTGQLLNVDKKGLEKRRLQRKLQKEKDQEMEVLKNDVKDIKDMLSKLLDSEK